MEENKNKRSKKHPGIKEDVRNKLSNKILSESPSLFLDLSENLLNRIDLLLINSDLSKEQQIELIKIFEEIFGEGYITSMTD
jgi:hypothetical protein